MVRIHSYLVKDTEENGTTVLNNRQRDDDNSNDAEQDRLGDGTSYVVEMVEQDTEVDVESLQPLANGVSINTDHNSNANGSNTTDTGNKETANDVSIINTKQICSAKLRKKKQDDDHQIIGTNKSDELRTQVRVTFSDPCTFDKLFEHWNDEPQSK
jgi:hypothetical protein